MLTCSSFWLLDLLIARSSQFNVVRNSWNYALVGDIHFTDYIILKLKVLERSLWLSQFVLGGYCFKPENAKAALKLLEMETVLSMELRAERTREPVSSIKTEV